MSTLCTVASSSSSSISGTSGSLTCICGGSLELTRSSAKIKNSFKSGGGEASLTKHHKKTLQKQKQKHHIPKKHYRNRNRNTTSNMTGRRHETRRHISRNGNIRQMGGEGKEGSKEGKRQHKMRVYNTTYTTRQDHRQRALTNIQHTHTHKTRTDPSAATRTNRRTCSCPC